MDDQMLKMYAALGRAGLGRPDVYGEGAYVKMQGDQYLVDWRTQDQRTWPEFDVYEKERAVDGLTKACNALRNDGYSVDVINGDLGLLVDRKERYGGV